MKKGIDAWSDYDRTGTWVLNIAKKKGKLTLEEIRQTAMEYGEDFYVLPIIAIDREDDRDGCTVSNNDGTYTHYDDLVQLYQMDDVWKEDKR